MSWQRAISFASNSGVFCVRPVMMPRPPAFETAEASSAKPTKCMPPWMIGCWMPNISVMAVFIAYSFDPMLPLGSDTLDDDGRRHAACGAHGDKTALEVAPFQLVQDCADQDRAGCADRMT